MPPLPPFSRNPQKNTWGGFQSAAFYSGAVAPGLNCAPNAVAVGSDVFLCSGAGRLDTLTIYEDTVASGLALPIVFYDAHAAVSGGPLYASGHKKIAFSPSFVVPVSGSVLSSGQLPVITNYGVPIQISAPFQSGLCFNSRSGQPGFTVTWTPEPAGQ